MSTFDIGHLPPPPICHFGNANTSLAKVLSNFLNAIEIASAPAPSHSMFLMNMVIDLREFKSQ